MLSAVLIPFQLINTMDNLRNIVLAVALLAGVSLFASRAQEPSLKPDATCAYVIRGADTLLLDIYRPTEGSETLWKGKAKPKVLCPGSKTFWTWVIPWFPLITGCI
jgi:hypothetical protein